MNLSQCLGEFSMILTLPIHLLLFVLSFICIWIGSGLVVAAISDLSKYWKLPAFVISFFFLGLITSLPEISISAIAILEGKPQIVVGNLLGGILVMFLLVIPLLAIVKNGIALPSKVDKRLLVFIMVLVVAPALLTADQRIGKWEALLLIMMYGVLFVLFSFKQSLWSKVRSGLMKKQRRNAALFFKILLGMLILIFAAQQIVISTLFFAEVLKISPFLISLLVVALGTNIPELSIVFRSVHANKTDIALADYLGSASANSLLLGIFTLMNGKDITLPNHFLQRFAFLSVGLVLFYIFARSKKVLSRGEGAVLIGVYVLFVVFELLVITQQIP